MVNGFLPFVGVFCVENRRESFLNFLMCGRRRTHYAHAAKRENRTGIMRAGFSWAPDIGGFSNFRPADFIRFRASDRRHWKTPWSIYPSLYTLRSASQSRAPNVHYTSRSTLFRPNFMLFSWIWLSGNLITFCVYPSIWMNVSCILLANHYLFFIIHLIWSFGRYHPFKWIRWMSSNPSI